MDKLKLVWPITIVVSSLLLASSYYFVQQNKQSSIERQQTQKLEAEQTQKNLEMEQKQKEYVAQRKSSCLDIYENEHKNWNNVNGWWYKEEDDACVIQYISSDWKPGTSELGEWNDTLKMFIGGKYFTKEY